MFTKDTVKNSVKGTVKGAKAGQEQPRTPIIAKDTASSVAYAKILYGLAEGEIKGLADGANAILLNDTPIIHFDDITWQFRAGTNDQEPINGFGGVESERAYRDVVTQHRPFVRTFTNSKLSALRVRLSWEGLFTQNPTTGDVSGATVAYAIDVQTDGGAFVTVLTTQVSDKVATNYERAHRVDLPKAKKWAIRVRRITPDSEPTTTDTMSVVAITEIIDAKLRYPNTAMLALRYDAKTFSNIAKLAVRLKGKIINVPSNYNADTREYTGLWDGTFKQAYSNNPAWVFYDICTQWRYGLGDRIDKAMIDKWSLYALGQYCDELVDDGKGGKEPRFTVNVYLQSSSDAFGVIQSLSSIFRAMSFWNGEQIVLDADMPKDPVFTFGRANVIDGVFNYTGTRTKDRHTVAKVAWDNPENRFNTEYEWVKDEKAIARLGIKVLDINMMGCTSQGQAQRAGLWALLSEQLQTRTVSFKTGLDGFIPQVGQVINIADNLLAGRAISGRIKAVNGNQITLDRACGRVGDTLLVNGDNGKLSQATITAINDELITTHTALDGVGMDNVWAIHSSDLVSMPFRVMSVNQDSDTTFTITALQYNEQKFNATDFGARVSNAPISVIEPNVLPAPSFIEIGDVNLDKVEQGIRIARLFIAWEQVKGAVSYDVVWQKDNDGWQQLPRQSTTTVQIDGVYSGTYVAKVTPINAFGVAGATATSDKAVIKGRVGAPPKLAFLTAKGVLFGVSLAWGFRHNTEDTNYTEIEQSPNGVNNISVLGQFAYPTDKHEITGLQSNLTQFYRGRIVDKLGNKSNWSDWVQATTDASADKVLDLLNGQLTKSHLHQSLATPIDNIGNELDGIKERINQSIKEVGRLTEQNSTQRQTINELKTTQNNLSSSISAINTALSRDNEALAQQVNRLSSEQGRQSAILSELRQTQATQEQSIAVAVQTLSTRFENQLQQKTDAIMRELNEVSSNQNGSLSQRLSSLQSQLGDKASTAVVNNLSTKVTQVGNKIIAEAQKIATLQSTLGRQSASIQSLQRVVNGNRAEYTLKVDVGGRVSGFGIASSSTTSDFAVRADKFYIAPPSGGKGNSPFMVLTAPQRVDGTLVPAGTYIKSAYIASGSITMLHIKDSIQSDNFIPNRQGWRLYKDGRLEINGQGADGSRVVLNNQGLTGYYDNGQKAFEIGIFL